MLEKIDNECILIDKILKELAKPFVKTVKRRERTARARVSVQTRTVMQEPGVPFVREIFYVP